VAIDLRSPAMMQSMNIPADIQAWFGPNDPSYLIFAGSAVAMGSNRAEELILEQDYIASILSESKTLRG